MVNESYLPTYLFVCLCLLPIRFTLEIDNYEPMPIILTIKTVSHEDRHKMGILKEHDLNVVHT